MENNDSLKKEFFLYTEEQLMARLKFFIGVCLAMTLTGIVFVVLYSLIFVTQPLNAISPIDQKFFELIVPIATFLTGTLSGIMLAGNDKEAQKMALQAATKPPPVTSSASSQNFNSGTFNSNMNTSSFGGQQNSFGYGSPNTNSFSSGYNTTFGQTSNTFGNPITMNAQGLKVIPDEPQPLI